MESHVVRYIAEKRKRLFIRSLEAIGRTPTTDFALLEFTCTASHSFYPKEKHAVIQNGKIKVEISKQDN